jgi:hypothetical protein
VEEYYLEARSGLVVTFVKGLFSKAASAPKKKAVEAAVTHYVTAQRNSIDRKATEAKVTYVLFIVLLLFIIDPNIFI